MGRSMLQSTTDEELIRRVLDGDTEQFAELIARYQDHVVKIVAGHVRRDVVAEVSQDVFVRAFTSLPTYEFRKPLEHWLSIIAVRACYDYWRGEGARTHILFSGIGDDETQWLDRALAAESQERLEQMVRQTEAAEVLRAALDRLSAPDRMVLTLVHLEGRSMAEAGELLGWTVANVKVRAHRARHRLRRILVDLTKEKP